jgi:hypothetical protein
LQEVPLSNPKRLRYKLVLPFIAGKFLLPANMVFRHEWFASSHSPQALRICTAEMLLIRCARSFVPVLTRQVCQ